MLTMINEDRLRTPEDVESEYKNCKYILTDFGNMQEPKGHLFCISTSNDSFKEICQINYDMSKKGIQCILLGSYNNGGAIGVQYEVK